MHSTRSDTGSLDPNLVPLLVSKTDTTMYGQVAILTFLVYDTSKFCILMGAPPGT